MGELDILKIFYEESEEFLDAWENILLALDESKNDDEQTEHLGAIFRYAHNLKGSAASVGLQDFYQLVHQCEELIEAFRIK